MPSPSRRFVWPFANPLAVYRCFRSLPTFAFRPSAVILLAGLLAASPARGDSPPFTDVGAELLGVQDGSMSWADYDGDNDLDLLVAGSAGVAGSVTRLYRNHDGVFSQEINAVLPGLSVGTAAWADYDGDGDPDLLLAGSAAVLGPISRVYRNDGGGVFTWEENAGMPGVSNGSAAWADYDGDGAPDILLTGMSGSLRIARLYHNDGGGVFSQEPGAVLPGVTTGSVAWADYDDDGDLDLLLTGNAGFARISRVYRNDGDGVFAWETNAIMLGVANSSAAWGDYDNDDDPDILLTGNVGSGLIAWVYRNDGGGVFTRDTDVVLPGAYFSSVAWGDYDNDDDPDILLTGESDAGKIARIYRNDGAGAFVYDASVALPGVARSSVALADYDGDGDLDLALSGYTGLARIAQVWNNGLLVETPTTNQPPLADAGGPYVVECAGNASGVQLDGSASSDPDGDGLLYQWFIDLPDAEFDDPTSATPVLYFDGTAGMTFEVKLAVMDADFVSVATSTVTAVDTVPPSITPPADIVELPESPAGNVVTYAPLAADACDSFPTVACAPPSGSTFAPGTTTTVQITASDDSGNTSHASFTVHILSAAEVLPGMNAIVQDLQADGRLNKGEANGLSMNLKNIQASLARGNTNATRGQLEGFIDKVRSFMQSGKLPQAEGQALLDAANAMLASLGG